MQHLINKLIHKEDLSESEIATIVDAIESNDDNHRPGTVAAARVISNR